MEVGGYEHVVVTDMPASLDNLADFAIHDCVLHLNILHHAGHEFRRRQGGPNRGRRFVTTR